MTLHPPKLITSTEGLGVGTTKTMRKVNDHISIATEVWNTMKEPWAEGATIIAKPGYVWETKWEVGKPYIITKFYDAAANLVAIYCDVSRPVQKTEGGFSFVDLYLDVWQPTGQEPVILDEDELEEAVRARYITPEEADEARDVARQLVNNLKNNPNFLDF